MPHAVSCGIRGVLVVVLVRRRMRAGGVRAKCDQMKLLLVYYEYIGSCVRREMDEGGRE